MAGVFKAIKPQRFNERAFWEEIYLAARDTADQIEEDYQKTTATWDHKPEFEKVVDVGEPVSVLVATDDEIYRYVDEGTDPHPIFAGIYTGKSSKKALAFPSAFTSKSVPGVIGSRSGSRGGSKVTVPYVQHPGGRAFGFTEAIEKKWQPRFKNVMEKAMRNAAKASGHAAD